jgi:hypothetical protein
LPHELIDVCQIDIIKAHQKIVLALRRFFELIDRTAVNYPFVKKMGGFFMIGWGQ